MLPLIDNLPVFRRPVAVYTLILLNVLVFLLELMLDDRTLAGVFYLFGLVPARYTHPDWAMVMGLPLNDFWPFLTSQFLHGDWLHLFFNMWTLWIFGPKLEDRFGPAVFTVFYLCAGISAGVVQWFSDVESTVPTVGASGAIAGVMGGYFLLYPAARLVVMVPIWIIPLFFQVSAYLYLVFWFALQFYNGAFALLQPELVGNVAWWAHIGGFVAGMVMLPVFLRCSACPPQFVRVPARPDDPALQALLESLHTRHPWR